MDQNFPDLATMAKNLALKLDAVEIIRQPLYDYQLYPTAGQLFQMFFQTPIGAPAPSSASPGNVAGAKSTSDTNMQLGGQLAAPQAFWVEGIEVDVQPGSVSTANTFTLQAPSVHVAAAAATVQAGENDVNNIYSTGVLTFNVGGKNYYQEGPLYRFPTRQSLVLDASMASNSATAAEDVKAKLNCDGEMLTLDPGIGIMTSINFGVTINWPSVIATPSGFNARIGVVLNGWLFRAVQ